MSKLVKVAETKEVAPGTGKVVGAEGRSLALFNVAGTFYAIDDTLYCTPEMRPRSAACYGTGGRPACPARHRCSNSSGVRYPSDE